MHESASGPGSSLTRAAQKKILIDRKTSYVRSRNSLWSHVRRQVSLAHISHEYIEPYICPLAHTPANGKWGNNRTREVKEMAIGLNRFWQKPKWSEVVSDGPHDTLGNGEGRNRLWAPHSILVPGESVDILEKAFNTSEWGDLIY